MREQLYSFENFIFCNFFFLYPQERVQFAAVGGSAAERVTKVHKKEQ